MTSPPRIIYKGWKVNCFIATYIVLSVGLMFGIVWIVDQMSGQIITRYMKEHPWGLKVITLILGGFLKIPIYIGTNHLKKRQEMIDDSYLSMLKKQSEYLLTKEAEWIIQQFIEINHYKAYEIFPVNIQKKIPLEALKKEYQYPPNVSYMAWRCYFNFSEKREVSAVVNLLIESTIHNDEDDFFNDLEIRFIQTSNGYQISELGSSYYS